MSQSANQQEATSAQQVPLKEIIITAELAARPMRQAIAVAETACGCWP